MDSIGRYIMNVLKLLRKIKYKEKKGWNPSWWTERLDAKEGNELVDDLSRWSGLDVKEELK